MKEETLGQVFKRYRETERIKVERVEKDTKISKRMLVMIEDDDYQNLPDDLYTKNIIKTYANYLSLDFNKLLNLYEQSKKIFSQNQLPITKQQKVKVYLTPQRTRNAIILLIILALVGYLGLELKKIYEPPLLVVSRPDKNIITEQNFIEIKGQTEKEARVYINEKEVFLDPQGEFKATLDLQKGLNLITISAVKKQGKANTAYREILVQ